MVVYSSNKFLVMLAASIIVGLLLVSIAIVILPSYLGEKGSVFRATTLSSPATLKAGERGSFTMTLNSMNGFSGPVELSARVTNGFNNILVDVSPARLIIGANSATTFTLIVDSTATLAPGDYTVTVRETSAGFSHDDTITVRVAGFTATASPTSLHFDPGLQALSNITITSVNGFEGNIVLSTSTSAQGPIASDSLNSFYLNAGATVLTSLTVKSAIQGIFDVTVTAISDKAWQSVTLPVTVGSTQAKADFDLSLAPNPLNISTGTSQSLVLKLTSTSGCACLVTLTASPPGVGFGVGLSPSIIGPLQAKGEVDSTVFVNAAATVIPGTFTVTITGTSLSTSRSTLLTIIATSSVVPDFAISANPLSLAVGLGASVSTEITVQSIGSFAGQVDLTASITPTTPGITTTLSGSTLTIAANGVAKSTLTISIPSAISLLAYNFTVTAKSGTYLRTLVGSIQVSPGLSASPMTTTSSTATRTTAPSQGFW